MITALTESAAIPLDPDAPVLFSGGIPSNFYPAIIALPDPFWVDGSVAKFATTEHYFQAAKVAAFCRQTGNTTGYLSIACADRPGQSKTRARKLTLPAEHKRRWDNGLALNAMLACNLAKYAEHPALREWLLSTGDRPLIEHRPDAIWGDNLDGTGRNQLGLVLMIVRDQLRDTH